MSIKAIIFDLDGTLYDLADIAKVYYDIEIRFLKDYFHKTGEEAAAFLSENGVTKEPSEKAKSATDLFYRIGVPKKVWVDFREKYFDPSGIKKEKAVSEAVLREFSEQAPIYLLSSNTYCNIEKILDKIGLAPTLFKEVYCSDKSPCGGIFTKKEVIASLIGELSIQPSELLSVGDRYNTDVVPALELGAKGAVVKEPAAVSALLEDLKAGKPATGDSYTWYEA